MDQLIYSFIVFILGYSIKCRKESKGYHISFHNPRRKCDKHEQLCKFSESIVNENN